MTVGQGSVSRFFFLGSGILELHFAVRTVSSPVANVPRLLCSRCRNNLKSVGEP